MCRTFRVVSCGILSIASMFCTSIVVAQNRANSNDLFGGEGIDITQLRPAETAPESLPLADPVVPAAIALPAQAAPNAGAPEDLCRCVGEDSSAEQVARIYKALRSPLKEAGLDYTEQPLEEVVSLLQEEYDIPIKLDLPAMKEIKSEPDRPVSVNLHGISLGAALRLMLKELDLTYGIHDEILLITSEDAEQQRLQTCVYDVRDLMHDGKRGNDFDTLIDSIVSCIATESWAENGGGESEIRPMQPGFLIISQTGSVHDEIRGLLNTIRQLKARPIPAAADARNQTPSSEEVVTQAYRLQFGNATVTDELRTQVRDLIVKSLPDERWDGRVADGQSVLLAVMNDRVVVRHKPEVQALVEELLIDSGIVAADSANFRGCLMSRPAESGGKK